MLFAHQKCSKTLFSDKNDHCPTFSMPKGIAEHASKEQNDSAKIRLLVSF
jgi:hypothetical protein